MRAFEDHRAERRHLLLEQAVRRSRARATSASSSRPARRNRRSGGPPSSAPGRISKSRTGTPRRAICHAASLPARPAPTTSRGERHGAFVSEKPREMGDSARIIAQLGRARWTVPEGPVYITRDSGPVRRNGRSRATRAWEIRPMNFSKTTAILLLTAAVDRPRVREEGQVQGGSRAGGNDGSTAAASGDSRPAATVGGTVDHDGRPRPRGGQPARQDSPAGVPGPRRTCSTAMIQQKLVANEAAARKVTEADLIKTEVDDKTTTPTPDEVSQYYDKMKARMGGKTLDEVKGDIEKALKAQKSNERRAQFLTELSAKNEVKIMLDPPRATVTLRPGAPVTGPGRRAGHDRRVVRLPVPVLQARASDRRAGPERVQGQGPVHLPRLPASVPPDGDAGRPGGSLRRGPGQVLGIPQEPLRGSRAT